MPNNLLPKSLSALRIAVGHDDLTVPYAGGEKVFTAIVEIFPEADVFTSMITPEWKSKVSEIRTRSEITTPAPNFVLVQDKDRTRSEIAIPALWDKGSDGRRIITSFMQKIPAKRRLQKALFLLYPLAFESLDFSEYDLVISSSSRFAHGVVTRPETKHICYMHSPGRMFWEPNLYFASNPGLGKLLSPILSYLRLWDHAAAQRVDQFVANSKNIARKIKRYYGREALVIYPFVDLDKFQPLAMTRSEIASPALRDSHKQLANDYFLVVTRLESWKRVEIAIEAASEAGANLKVVGGGSDRKRLERLAFGPTSHEASRGKKIKFLGSVGDEELVELYQNCKALIMTQEEDFGITSLEAQACGKPVIAYGAGGVLETVVEGKTGEFFYPQTAEALALVLKKFDPAKYDSAVCRANAEKFSKERFQKELLKVVEGVLASK
ncbi:MAG: glycosyltransferase [candidate division WWE3 bacterium]|nr:glycosyltransferase [candidate division WWE3 bacterium]